MSDIVTVKGAKAGSSSSSSPSIAADSIASTSTAKILYGLAEGEISGLVDGGKSIRLNGTPLLDDSGAENFDGVTWDFREGTNEQEYIKGFPDVSNETAIGVELTSDNPWVQAFTDTQLSAVRVRLKWNALQKTDDEDGDVTGYRIDYKIDLQTDGGAYQNVLTTKIEDKASTGYERTHRINLPKANTGWQIRVTRITPNSTSQYIQDTMYIDAVAEVIDVKLRYPNTALLGLQYNAETFSSIAKIEVHARGSIIRVPSNYDPIERTYTGIWDGTFKDAYSNNPAWVYYDLCMQWRYGLGERLDSSMVDKWSLYTLGQYCDGMVSDGQGGLEPRFTCNVYLQTQAEAYTVLSNIAGIFRALSFWNGEQVYIDADVPQDAVYTFSRANVVDGNFEYTGTRARDRHTLAKVAWDNPNNNFETEYEYVRDEESMAKYGVNVLDLSAFGCTSQAQAQRAGLWALKTEQLETRQVAFSVGLDGNIPTIGNIINISDELFAGRANGGRVSAVNDTQYIVTIDRDVTVDVGDVLIVNGGNGKSERRTIDAVNGRELTVSAPFDNAESENVWAIETDDLQLMKFRVMSITQNDDVSFNITAIQHEPQKYDAIDYNVDVKPTDITIVNPQTVDAPSFVTVSSRHRVSQGQTIATFVIEWGQVEGAVAYEVEWQKDDGTWIKEPRTGNVSLDIDGVYSGNYTARVKAVNAYNVYSRSVYSTLTAIEGKAGLPPTPVGLSATGILFGMDLKWGFADGSGDGAYTEIQVGSAPNTNVATLTQVSYPTNTYTSTGLQGGLSQSYRVRLIDKLGFTSEWSSWVTGVTDNSADLVMDLIQGQIDESALDASLQAEIAKIDDLESGFNTLETTVNDGFGEQNERIDSIVSDYDPEYADSSQYADASRSIAWTYWKTVARDNYALAQKTEVIQTSVGANTASIETQQTSINGLNAQYTVKVDVGGYVSGFGLASSATQSDFSIRADKFYIAPPSNGTNSTDSPFMVLTTPTVIDGTTVPSGTYIQSAYIHNGAIDSAQIKDAAITTAKIGTAAIKSAQIADLAVTNGKIADLSVDTLQIAGSAVTVARAVYNSNTFDDDGTSEAVRATTNAEGGYISAQVFVDYALAKRVTSDIFAWNGRVDIIIERLDTNETFTYNLAQASFSDTYVQQRYVSLPPKIIENTTGDLTIKVSVKLDDNATDRGTSEVKGVTLVLTGVKR